MPNQIKVPLPSNALGTHAHIFSLLCATLPALQIAASSWQENQEKAAEVSEAERQFADAKVAELDAQIAALQTELLAADEAVRALESKARAGARLGSWFPFSFPQQHRLPSAPFPPASLLYGTQCSTCAAATTL